MEYTEALKESLSNAYHEAAKRRHEYVTLEHVLYALINDDTTQKIILACGGDLKKLRQDLEAYLEENMEVLPEGAELEPEQTQMFSRVFQRALMHVHSSGHDQLHTSNLLVAFYREHDSYAVFLLQEQNITRLDVVRYISHGISKVPTDSDEHGFEDTISEEGSPNDGKDKDPLAAFTVNLNEAAAAGRIDPLIGRNKEIERTIQILCRRRKNNPIFVGDPGVGKTALAEGLALRIHEKKVPQILADSTIYSLDMGALIAGTKFRGEFEERLKGVLKAIKDIEGAIVFIDEIHTVVGAGATHDSSLDASNLLKPALQSGELKCMGSTTHKDYKSSIEKDHALARRFQKIKITEPSIDETTQILKGLRSRYEEHHEVKYSDRALRTAAELSAKHINERFLPDKAIDVIDEAGAATRLQPPEKRKSRITPKDIEMVVSKIAQIPPKSVSNNDKQGLQSLESDLKMVIFGQGSAIESLSSAIKLSRSGLGAPDKPTGSFLFAGPTGVGKTELAKQLARVMGIEFLRFDMSEYMEKHAVSRLIGAPPGYVGFEQGGLMTDAIRKTPYCVLLLDEIEKAHFDIYNVLLQVMDHASLTDNTGRKADFRNVILIMTTNAGSRDIAGNKIGFGGESDAHDGKKELERIFSPEFRNRLDATISFEQLPEDVVLMVVDKFINELDVQLAEKKVTIDLSLDARKWFAKKGYSKQYGARPMARIIQNELKRSLADAILFGELSQGGHVDVDVDTDDNPDTDEGKLVLKFSQTDKSSKKPKAKQRIPTGS
jgi:ATP-dependent Clp protease ATP-binding subunit ClpA